MANNIQIREVSTGKIHPGLRNVFRRKFPIVAHRVKVSGGSFPVTYNGNAYMIEVKTGQ